MNDLINRGNHRITENVYATTGDVNNLTYNSCDSVGAEVSRKYSSRAVGKLADYDVTKKSLVYAKAYRIKKFKPKFI